ncbi:hypothetical protein CON36_34030 [Bacillus cereus]|uniref:DUF7352 domain-containing protein n=2 Tax=Bacillus cereus group TaxID=86661 RepID=A0A9X6XV32_BACCE|nr:MULTISPECIES: hypothetical protein [Bacillus cereus group]PDZ94400.1 hypothetical protein CON36_34030 [Bacillus cereus]PFJ33126.1 hypothetical protein COJ15_28185 [Bacillus thuringiensis]PGP14531.1 hypothetical protein COA01_29655 [Bacillus cereus]
MYSVWKFVLESQETQMLEVPLGAEILSTETQGDDIVVYALVDTEQTEKEYKDVRVYGTGVPIPDVITEYNFLGTAKFYNGSMMFHVFYK